MISKRFLKSSLFLWPVLVACTAHAVDAQTIEINDFCQKYPGNSQCEGYISDNPNALTDSPKALQGVIVRFDTTGSDNESVLLEITDEMAGYTNLSAYHIKRFENSNLLSGLLNGGIETAASGIPLPFDLFQFYDSASSQTESIVFTPDSCQAQSPLANGNEFQNSDCSVTGTDTISLSEEIDIRSGTFTLGYNEGKLSRTLTFRISDHDAAFVDELETDRLCQNYPLNVRCRYWPISQAESSEAANTQ